MAAERRECWIDVGGTFTDCLAELPDGAIRRHKLLSSGATKGRAGGGFSRRAIVDPARRNDPADFWTGWSLAIVGDDGRELDHARVTGFEPASGRLELSGLAHQPSPAAAYELHCGLEAPVIAIRYLLAIPLAEPVPPVSLRLGDLRPNARGSMSTVACLAGSRRLSRRSIHSGRTSATSCAAAVNSRRSWRGKRFVPSYTN